MGEGGGQDVKDRRVIFGILPCVAITGLETDASMAIIACILMLMVRSKSESTQGAVAILKEKKGPRLSISKFRSKEVYSAESWANKIGRFGGTREKIFRTHLVRNSNWGKKRAISRRYPKR